MEERHRPTPQSPYPHKNSKETSSAVSYSIMEESEASQIQKSTAEPRKKEDRRMKKKKKKRGERQQEASPSIQRATFVPPMHEFRELVHIAEREGGDIIFSPLFQVREE
jgi:hypothetical protein